jgi:predicted outer membrane repeat protein
MRAFTLIVGAAALLLGMSPAGATTYTVLPDGSGDFPTIQAAVDAAVSGDVIELGSGTFRGIGNRDITIDEKVLAVRSQSGNPATCTIDCQGAGRGLHLTGWSQARRQLTGISVIGGDADYGGGILDDSHSGSTVTDCVFYRNTAAHTGGGMDAFDVPVTLTRCKFIENTSGDCCGGFAGGRAGESIVTIEDCQFIGNTAAESGGAVFIESLNPARETVLRNCVFFGNSAQYGGALVISVTSAAIEQCTFAYNAAGPSGGILWAVLCDIALDRCIIAFSTDAAGVRCERSLSSATLTCCDVYGNEGGDWVGCLAGQDGQNGNLRLDPLFCDGAGGDLRLQEGSPCAPDANSECDLIGARPVGCQPTPVETKTWGAIKGMFR